MKSIYRLIAVAAIFAPLCLSASEQNYRTVTAEGMAGIVDQDKAMARDQAIDDALRKAVEQAVGTIISSETMVENYQVLSDSIYSRTQGYIQNYKITKENAADSLYHVTINAKVAAGNLKNDLAALGLLMARKNMPRVMIMVAEQNIGQDYYFYWWKFGKGEADLTVSENTLMKILSQKGFIVIDHGAMGKSIQLSNAYKIKNLSNDAIKKFGHLYDAEVVIYGKALAKLSGSLMGTQMKSVQADISLRAINTDTGQVIATAVSNGAAVHPSEVTAGSKALQQTTEQAADDLISQIVTKWGGDVSGKAIIRIEISGIEAYNNLVKFKKSLKKKIRGINGIYQRSFDSGKAILDIEMAGSAQTLADEISMITYQGFGIDIQNLTQNSIKLKMKKQ